MMSKSFYVLTGATSGMGLHIAEALSQLPNAVVIAGVRSLERAATLSRSVPESQLIIHPLDLDSLESVSAFAKKILNELPEGANITSIICNAGLQLSGSKEMTSSKIERTFMVNHLSHFHLVETLLPHLIKGGSVVTVGSGTHNPNDKIAKMFGFRGAIFPSAEKIAFGDLGTIGNDTALNMDRYATSKLAAIYYALAMAERIHPSDAVFYSFDPGLMPGTGLARERSVLERFGWTYILPIMRYVISGISTSENSGRALVKHCIEDRHFPSGSYIEFTGRVAPRSDLSMDTKAAHSLIDHSLTLC